MKYEIETFIIFLNILYNKQITIKKQKIKTFFSRL